MKRKLGLLALVAAVLLSAASVLADGDFYVIAGGGPPVGTKISSLPASGLTIANPGFYYLTGNLTFSGTGTGITITSNDVTLDLMGFRLMGPGSNGGNSGIRMSGQQNVEIRNGTLSGWYGAIYESGPGALHRAVNLRVENCAFGIYLDSGGGVGEFLVKGCMVDVSTSGYGIYLSGGIASGNVVSHSGNAISLGVGGNGNVIGNSVITINSINAGITISTNEPVLVTHNSVSGPGTHFTPGAATVNVNNAF